MSPGTRLEKHSGGGPQPQLQGRQTPLLQSRLQTTKAEQQRRAALLPDSSTGVLCTEPSQPRHLLSGPSVVLRTGLPSPHIMGRCKAKDERHHLEHSMVKTSQAPRSADRGWLRKELCKD